MTRGAADALRFLDYRDDDELKDLCKLLASERDEAVAVAAKIRKIAWHFADEYPKKSRWWAMDEIRSALLKVDEEHSWLTKGGGSR